MNGAILPGAIVSPAFPPAAFAISISGQIVWSGGYSALSNSKQLTRTQAHDRSKICLRGMAGRVEMSASDGCDYFIIEFHRVGNAVKASACDPTSLIEVSIVGSATTPESLLERAAIRKLKYILAKKGAVKPQGRFA